MDENNESMWGYLPNTSGNQADYSSWKDDKIKLLAKKHHQYTTNF